MPNEIYFFERSNGISTWHRPFDYADDTDGLTTGEQWKVEHLEQQREQARAKAKQDKPKSQTAIPGTDWSRVLTEQGRTYYCNSETGQSRWDIPEDLAKTLADQASTENEVEAENTELNAEDADWMLEQMADELMDDMPLEASDAEVEEPAEPAAEKVSKDDKLAQFNELLKSASLNPFGTWESEQLKIAADPRFRLIDTDAERHCLFDAVCTDLIAQRRQQQAAARPAKLAGDPFDQLLQEKVTSKKLSFAKFCQQNRKDPRFLKLRSSRDREKRFNKHIGSM
ncbi:hypothetical protein DL89DRAFT_320380 [Linderina pennispora]|uniref:WW domain-containing protein n=1 Tax=Linderina pennispora TaxID=61395 RepID=A0A1Y1WNZ8_9FUNG|nr:uncharacterized protein DL89DRAFT_320380 [Linderina pennispora]ORX74986.1 hypothetical protein DL89DRAFT_320380 [Linderina pennispora]